MFAFNKISYKDTQQTFFCVKHIYRDFKATVGKKIQSSPGNCYQTFCFSLSVSITENNGKHLRKCIFQRFIRAQFQFFLGWSMKYKERFQRFLFFEQLKKMIFLLIAPGCSTKYKNFRDFCFWMIIKKFRDFFFMVKYNFI